MTNRQIAVVTGPLPALGQFWEGQGGVRVGEVRGENGAPNYQLILAIDAASMLRGAWGEPGQEVSGARSLRNGLSNTIAMAEADSYLAKQVLSLEIEGHSDFYIPAPLESSFCNLNAGEYLDKKHWHWTSAQYSAHLAWVQHFAAGNQYNYHKNNEFAVRPVRRVIHSII